MTRRDELRDRAEKAIGESSTPEAWQIQDGGAWMYFERVGGPVPRQGWKLHLSATPRSAPAVLAALLPILLEETCSFKVVATLNLLDYLNSANFSRSASGKFVTIYPADEAQAVNLAEACHQATRELEGPVILSDRSYRKGSLVHYRFGAFVGESVYALDGSLKMVIRDPEGRPVPDDREAWFTPPAWTADPFPPEEKIPAAKEDAPAEFVLGGRFQLVGALRHTNKGGIYKATDLETGRPVVVKEARPLVAMDFQGRDVVVRLKAEYDNLCRLSELGVVPEPLAHFEQLGHSFLAMEMIEGGSLTALMVRQRREKVSSLPPAKVHELALAVTRLLKTAHRSGLAIRDFTPNNILVGKDGLLLIDPELACEPGFASPIAPGGGTPGYMSPNQLAAGPPALADDYYSLGATLYFLACARDPLFLPDDGPGARSQVSRFRDQLELMVADGTVEGWLAEVILGCLAEDPEARFSAEEAERRIEAGRRGEAGGSPPAAAVQPRFDHEHLLATVRGIAEFAAEQFDFSREDRPLRTSCLGEQVDAVNVQYGVAGVAAYLSSSAELGLAPPGASELLAQAARWIFRSYEAERERPPGLYFGQAGAAWSALDIGLQLGDRDTVAAAEALLFAIGAKPPLYDITHGAAGIALAHLHFFEALGERRHLERAAELGEQLLAAAQRPGADVQWPALQNEAGQSTIYYGFAHGTAGIAYMLLLLAKATGRSDFLATGLAAAETLVRAAQVDGEMALWPHGPTQSTRWPHWCNGSSGVGTTLIRFYAATGDVRFRDLAVKAGNAVVALKWWHGSTSKCHGPAGNGELLLDLYRFLGDETHLLQAQRLADVLYSVRVLKGGRTLFADDSQLMVSPDFAIGAAGVGYFLRRLALGGPRPFMVDSLLGKGA